MSSKRVVLLGLGAAVAIAAVTAVVALRGGKAGSEDPAERLLRRVPADAATALVVPNHSESLTQLGRLLGRFRGAVGGLDGLISEGSRRAGFDLNKPETMAEAGLSPAGGTALAAGQDWAGVWIAVDDREAFSKALAERTRREVGDELTWREESRDGWAIRVLQAKGEPPKPVLALGYEDGHAIVAPARSPAGAPVDPVDGLMRLRRVTRETSLLARPEFAGPSGRVGLKHGALVWADLERAARLGADVEVARGQPRNAEALGKAAGYVRGLVAGLSVEADAVRAPIAIDGDKTRLAEVAAAFSPAAPGPDYARVVPADGTLLVSLAFNPTLALPWLRTVMLDHERGVMDRSIAEASRGSGIDLEKEVLPALSGHVAFVFHTFDLQVGLSKLLANLGAAASQVAERPGTVQTSTWVGVKDPGTLTRVVEQSVAKATEQGGAAFSVEAVDGKPAWRIRQGDTEFAAFAVEGSTLVFTTGTGRLDQALAGLSSQPPPGMGSAVRVEAARRALKPDNTVAVYLSVATLLDNFPILNLLPAVARPAKRLGEVALFLRLTDAGVDGEALITLPPQPEAAGAPPAAGKSP